MLNLIRDAWIPVAVRGGAHRLVAPHELAERDLTAFRWNRADFNLSCREFAVGLLQLAFATEDDGEWLRRYRRPDPGEWHRALLPWAPFFELMGPGPRFAQDLEPFEAEVGPSRIRSACGLFVDAPGRQTIDRNADILVNRRERPLTAGEAAMALFTLQAHSPAGGAGHRVSMRGGGPLTTLVAPMLPEGADHVLARQLWANVLPRRSLRPDEAAEALPWLRPTRLSKDGTVVRHGDSHPAEAWFGQPRRLRLVDAAGGTVASFCQLPYGNRYRGWRHPFSPQYRRQADSDWLPVRAAVSLDQRRWLAWSLPERNSGIVRTRPASVVDAFRARNPDRFQLLVGGWTFFRAKPLDFEAFLIPAVGRAGAEADDRLGRLGEASGAYAEALRSASGLKGASGDLLIEEFLYLTSLPFSTAISGIEAGVGVEVEADWHGSMLECAEELVMVTSAPPHRERNRLRMLSSFGTIASRKLGLPPEDARQPQQHETMRNAGGG